MDLFYSPPAPRGRPSYAYLAEKAARQQARLNFLREREERDAIHLQRANSRNWSSSSSSSSSSTSSPPTTTTSPPPPPPPPPETTQAQHQLRQRYRNYTL